MRKLCEEIDIVANTDLAVLITGETGTGKRAGGAHAARTFPPQRTGVSAC